MRVGKYLMWNRLGRYFTKADNTDIFRREPLLSDQLLSFISQGKVLDIACGRGWFMSKLQKKGYEVTGIDISLPRLKEASKQGFVVQGSTDALPFKNNSFQIVTSLLLLHHMRNPWQALDEAHRVVSNGGIIYITESVQDNPVFSFLRSIYPYWDQDPVKSKFARRELKKALTDHRFEILLENTWDGNVFWAWEIIADRLSFLHKLTPLVVSTENQMDKWTNRYSCAYRVIARKLG